MISGGLSGFYALKKGRITVAATLESTSRVGEVWDRLFRTPIISSPVNVDRMALAFLILAHKNPQQVAQLFEAVYRPQDTIILHFDRRSDPSLHRLGRELAERHSNVKVLEPRTIVVAGFPATEVQVAAMELALKASDDWHHFLNISGQDFPLKRLKELEARLLSQREANYIPWFEPLACSIWRNARERIERYYIDWVWLDRLLRVRGLGRRLRKVMRLKSTLPYLPFVKRKMPAFRYYGGSNYVVLSRAACQYVVSDPRARRILRWLRHSMHSDEIFIQSILLNSPLGHTVIDANLHEIDFKRDSPHPKTYTAADLDRLLASPKYFARKFDASVDPAPLDNLAKRIA